MASTSCSELAQALLEKCLREESGQRELLDRLLAEGCEQEVFRVVIEGLSDRFDPRLCRVYEDLFAPVFGGTGRRSGTQGAADAATVYVLSRVTLGADVAITSVILDAAKQRFPGAKILLAGSRKSWELFAADPRIGHCPVNYPRSGTVAERIAPALALRSRMEPDAIVIDPDSRLTQLGLVPVCDPSRYFLFGSRSYGGEGVESLTVLAQRWVREIFQVDAHPYLAPQPGPDPGGAVTISLGVGENPAKRIPDPFERDLLRAMVDRGFDLFIDRGAGGEESERVDRAIAGLPPERVRLWEGAFAPFAHAISRSCLYVGYDSAGQHVAAAAGVPLLSIFAGSASERMFQRWRPTGLGKIEVVRATHAGPDTTLRETQYALARLGV